MKEYNIGIIGLGKIANRYAESLSVIPNAKLYAVSSRSMDKANEFKNRYNAVKAYDSYLDLLGDSLVDLVYIATPTSFHYENILEALNYNKHVICEKSFTLNTQEAEHIFKIAKQRNLFVMEALWSRFNPTLLEIKKLVENGEIGDVIKLDSEFHFNSKFDPNSRLYNKSLGGGALLDVGIYPITFTDMIVGLNYLKIKTDAEITSTGVDQSNYINLQYKNINAFLSSGFDKQGLNFAYIYGTKGYIKISDFWATTYAEVIKNEKVTKIIKNPFLKNGLEYETIHALECLDKGLIMSPVMSHGKTIEIMTLMDSLRDEWGVRYNNE